MKVIFILISLFVSINIMAAKNTKATKKVELKKGGAVIAFSEEDGFKLSKKATKNLGVSFSAVKGNGPWVVPKSSLVRIKHSTGVYRKWDGWITLVLVKVLNQTAKTVTIKSLDLEAQDEIATTGVSFLRMTDADLNADTVDACAH
jgi:hypothetical protein